MAYVEVPKDMKKVQPKIIGGLTKRQAIGFGIGGGIGLPLYLYTQGIFGQDVAMIFFVCVAFPSVFISMYEKDGIPAEELIKSWLRFKFVRPGIRLYKTTKRNAFLERGGKKNVVNSNNKSKKTDKK